jgi:FMN-dependent NADH-azoreductase
MMIRDFGSYLVSRQRRQVDANGKRRKVLFVVEEAGAVAGDPVIGKEFVDLVERARTAGCFSVLSAQDPMGLGDERAQSAILTNAAVATYRQTTQAEMVAQLAGTRRTDEGSATYNQAGRIEGEGGSTRRQYAMKLNPQLLRELKAGELVVIAEGKYAYVVAAMTKAGFALPESARAKELMDRLYDAQDLEQQKPGLEYRHVPKQIANESQTEEEEEEEYEPRPKIEGF